MTTPTFDAKENQIHKDVVWDYWQKMNYVEPEKMDSVVRAAMHPDVNYNVSQPINHLEGVEAVVAGFWRPLRASFPDIQRKPYIFMGGSSGGEQWVSGVGYLTGTFVQDWLGIPATGEKTNIHFGEFYLMREGKIAESYGILDMLAVMRQAGFQVLPPARGGEGGKVPRPKTGDGVLLIEQDGLETRKTAQLVENMLRGMTYRTFCSPDSKQVRIMEKDPWRPDMHWYGPSGIGACLDFEEFVDFHDQPWVYAFGEWLQYLNPKEGRSIGMAEGDYLAEGKYSSVGIWDVPSCRHQGTYLGVPATGKVISFRDFDWYRREGDLLAQNWVPIDMIDIFLQLGVDLFDRLRRQVELRQRGIHWFDPSY